MGIASESELKLELELEMTAARRRDCRRGGLSPPREDNESTELSCALPSRLVRWAWYAAKAPK
jgi:hypothetical protein